MKFQMKFPDCKKGDTVECDYCTVVKDTLGRCVMCGAMTSWRSPTLNNLHLCSEECCNLLWNRRGEQPWYVPQTEIIEQQRQAAVDELLVAHQTEECWKDILIVVHDQLDYFRSCISSIRETTHNYNLFIWDNVSGPETAAFIESLQVEYASLKDPDWTFTCVRSDENIGFIEPNNKLAALGSAPHIICLNSDTKVYPFWDRAMIGHLNDDVALVGYGGGLMNPEGQGFGTDFGYNIDYVQGWCLCLSRSTYDQFGLFNKQLKFAYCEDADLSLRLKEAGKKIYGLHVFLVHHYQNKTVDQVHAEKKIDMESTFAHNHEYMRLRWKDYIDNHRILFRQRIGNAKVS